MRLVSVNGLPYNANRDPQAYRRLVGEPFRVAALLAARDEVRCRLLASDGTCLADQRFAGRGEFATEITFDTPGTRIVQLVATCAQTEEAIDLKLDVLAHAWIG